MSKKSSSKLYLVVPVFKGGTIFLEALKSAENCGIIFDEMIISFNEAGDQDFQTFKDACSTATLSGTYTVWRTRKAMDSLNHGRFMIENMKVSSALNVLVFFLAHDDRILAQPQTDSMQRFFSSLDPSSVYFPSYSCCKVEDYNTITEVIEYDELITSEEFFWRTQRQNIPTSMSGMVVPLSAWDDAIRILLKSGTGARFEHFLATAQHVKWVRFHMFIRTLIVSRPDSDAAYLTLRQHRRASLYYVMAFALSGRVVSFSSYLAITREIIKKSLGLMLAFVNINFKR
jgi:hypothetical protein